MFGLFKKKEPMSTDYVANHYSEIISDSIDDFSEMIDKSESFKSIKKPLVKKLSKELLYAAGTLSISIFKNEICGHTSFERFSKSPDLARNH